MPSVQPPWMAELPLQQQSVLFLAARGPDGIGKSHPCKDIQRAYRATVLMAGRYGRMLKIGEVGDSFMSLEHFSIPEWRKTIRAFLHSIDELPHHFVAHLMHGAQILGYKHPDSLYRLNWRTLYEEMCTDMHLNVEAEGEMDARLSDWGRVDWDDCKALEVTP